MPPPKIHKNTGKPPRTGDKELRIKYRNGVIDNFPRKAKDLRWSLTGHDYDVAYYKDWE